MSDDIEKVPHTLWKNFRQNKNMNGRPIKIDNWSFNFSSVKREFWYQFYQYICFVFFVEKLSQFLLVMNLTMIELEVKTTLEYEREG